MTLLGIERKGTGVHGIRKKLMVEWSRADSFYERI
jgi:hypothetical protein